MFLFTFWTCRVIKNLFVLYFWHVSFEHVFVLQIDREMAKAFFFSHFAFYHFAGELIMLCQAMMFLGLHSPFQY